MASVMSPSGSKKVVVFSRDCGATTRHNAQVSIVPANAEPDDGGNVLVLGYTYSLKIRWVSESQVSIAGVGSAPVFRQELSAAGVAIVYGK